MILLCVAREIRYIINQRECGRHPFTFPGWREDLLWHVWECIKLCQQITNDRFLLVFRYCLKCIQIKLNYFDILPFTFVPRIMVTDTTLRWSRFWAVCIFLAMLICDVFIFLVHYFFLFLLLTSTPLLTRCFLFSHLGKRSISLLCRWHKTATRIRFKRRKSILFRMPFSSSSFDQRCKGRIDWKQEGIYSRRWFADGWAADVSVFRTRLRTNRLRPPTGLMQQKRPEQNKKDRWTSRF